MLPSREWKRQRFAGKKYREEHRKWYLGDTISAGIGQGYNAFTPMQLAHAIATIANDGVAFTPHLVQARSQNVETGEERAVARAAGAHDRRSSPSTSRSSSNALVGVNKEGTQRRGVRGRARTSSGGKTGTAQVYLAEGREIQRDARSTSACATTRWFIAYAPADKPKIALAVLVENGGFGAQAAAPIARKVFDYYLLGQHRAGPARRRARRTTSDDESD